MFGIYVGVSTRRRTNISHSDPLSCRVFDEDNSVNDPKFFAMDNSYFAQVDLMNQAECKTNLGTNRLFHNIMKRTKTVYGDKINKQEKDSKNKKMH